MFQYGVRGRLNPIKALKWETAGRDGQTKDRFPLRPESFTLRFPIGENEDEYTGKLSA